MRCVHHQDRVTSTRCEICDHFFCDACLSPSAMGDACPGCLPAVQDLAQDIKKPSKSLPKISPLALVGGLVYWLIVIAPIYACVRYTLGLQEIRAYIGLVYDEPRKLGRVMEDLTALGAEIEADQIEKGMQWTAQSWAQKQNPPPDPYAANQAPYQLAPIPGGWVICSIGPDRMFDGGDPLDRFTGQGDICLKVRDEDHLALQ